MQKQEMAAAEATGDSVFNVAPLLLSGTQVIPPKAMANPACKSIDRDWHSFAHNFFNPTIVNLVKFPE